MLYQGSVFSPKIEPFIFSYENTVDPDVSKLNMLPGQPLNVLF